MKHSKIYKNWVKYLKDRALYGAFIYDFGKRLVYRQNNRRLDDYLFGFPHSLPFYNTDKNWQFFTNDSLNIDTQDDLKFLIMYNNDSNTIVNWMHIYYEYELCINRNSASKKRDKNKRSYKYEEDGKKWYDHFYLKGNKNHFRRI